jgi:site-specific DNA-methyltransferase (adenine-specific)
MTLEEMKNQVICGDCLEILKTIPDKSVDLVLTDPPYGQTQNIWDNKFFEWFDECKRISKKQSIISFGNGFFTAEMMFMGKEIWKYNIIWDKILASGFLNANKMPLRTHEDIIIFYKEQITYNPQKIIGEKNHSKGKNRCKTNSNYGYHKIVENDLGNLKHPKSIISISKTHPSKSQHPTEKPEELIELLIKTYTNEGDLILDPFLGSGTTAVACKALKRNFIGIEISPEYCEIARQRLRQGVLL